MDVRFWGTRGSLAKPGPTTLRYGGNTSCVEVRCDDGTLIVLDCGTGAHALGQSLLADGSLTTGHLLITHTHWDHIQGFPFFAPLFVTGHTWDIYAPGTIGRELEKTLAGQMEYAYFPVTLAQLGATIRFHDLGEGPFSIGGVRVTAQYLNHPALALGYRIESGGASLVYSVDHEPHAPDPVGPAGGPPAHVEDRRHVDLLADADLVIHDAQYTIEEYPQKTGWGHTPAEWAVDYAIAGGARRLALFHHDPLRTDDALDALVETCRARARAARSALDVFAAAEGERVLLAETGAGREARPAAETRESPVEGPRTVVIADDDPTIVELLSLTLAPDGFRVVTAPDGPSALRAVSVEKPALILLDWQMPGADGIEVTRAVRGHEDPALRDVPIVLITSQAGAENTAVGFAAGVTDYLTKPFRPAHVRARVQAWLLRRRSGPGGA